MIHLYHYTSEEHLESIFAEGLHTSSRYEMFTNLRKDVVYCWMSPTDQKIFSDSSVCLEIEVDESRCLVAEMDYISLAMMYQYGGKKYGSKNLPINKKASALFTQLYEITSIPIKAYDDNFFTPEVLVKGHVAPEKIKIYREE